MNICQFCNAATEDVVDGICDVCEPMWLDAIAHVSQDRSTHGNTTIVDLIRRANVHAHAYVRLQTALGKGGPVQVHLYEFGQNVRYVHLGEFAVDGGTYDVICTLERGKGGMRRTGLHGIVTHAMCAHAGSLPVADAVAIVEMAVRDFASDTTEQQTSNVRHAHEVLRVAAAAVKRGCFWSMEEACLRPPLNPLPATLTSTT